MAKKSTELATVDGGTDLMVGFNYDALPANVVEKVKETADRIKARFRRSLQDMIEIGQDLIDIKDSLGHGSWHPWLRSEFGFTEKTATNIMSLARKFSGKSETVSEMQIDVTAAYLLSSPTAPETVWNNAMKRAEKGEKITAKLIRDLIGKTRKARDVGEGDEAVKMALLKVAKKFYGEKEMADFVKLLKGFVKELEAAK